MIDCDFQNLYRSNGEDLEEIDRENLYLLEVNREQRVVHQRILETLFRALVKTPEGFQVDDSLLGKDYAFIKSALKGLGDLEKILKYFRDFADGLLDEFLVGALPVVIFGEPPYDNLALCPRELEDLPLKDLLEKVYLLGLDIEAYKNPDCRTPGKVANKDDLERLEKEFMPNFYRALNHFYTVETEKLLNIFEEIRQQLQLVNADEKVRFLIIKNDSVDPSLHSLSKFYLFVAEMMVHYKALEVLIEKNSFLYGKLEKVEMTPFDWIKLMGADLSRLAPDIHYVPKTVMEAKCALSSQIDEHNVAIEGHLAQIFWILDRAPYF